MSSFSSSVNTESPAPTLAKLSESLTTLAQTLDPLLAQPFQELREKLEGGSSVTANGEGEKDELGGKLDAARMQVSVAYVVLDLVWSESFFHHSLGAYQGTNRAFLCAMAALRCSERAFRSLLSTSY